MSALEQLAGRRILFLNWRDLSNPAAGGAEAYTEEIAAGFAGAGAPVTLFTGKYRARPVRLGSTELPRRAGGWPLRRVPGGSTPPESARGRQYDAIVDFQNGIPFFAPRLGSPAGTAVVCVVHHVHQRAVRHVLPLAA